MKVESMVEKMVQQKVGSLAALKAVKMDAQMVVLKVGWMAVKTAVYLVV